MTITIHLRDQPTERRHETWTWCFQNGFIATEIAGLVVIDTDHLTVRIEQFLPVSQPGDPDFPELRRDALNQPLTETRTLPLLVSPPDWMVAAAGARLAA